MKINMRLDGKITPMQSPGDLLMNAVPRPFNIFGSIRYDKTLAVIYKPHKPGYCFVLGAAGGAFHQLSGHMLADNMIPRDGIHSLHGFMKEPLLLLGIRRRLPLPLIGFPCLFGKGKALAVKQALQADEGIMH
jgi:hypothetical protein